MRENCVPFRFNTYLFHNSVHSVNLGVPPEPFKYVQYIIKCLMFIQQNDKTTNVKWTLHNKLTVYKKHYLARWMDTGS